MRACWKHTASHIDGFFTFFIVAAGDPVAYFRGKVILVHGVQFNAEGVQNTTFYEVIVLHPGDAFFNNSQQGIPDIGIGEHFPGFSDPIGIFHRGDDIFIGSLVTDHEREQVTLDPRPVHKQIPDDHGILTDPAFDGKLGNVLCDRVVETEFPVFDQSEDPQCSKHLGIGTDHE